MKRGYNRQEVADALYASVMGGEHMAPTGIDKLLQYEGTIANRGGVLPLMRRVVPDIGGDDISEFEGPLELAAPGLLYDPLSSMAKVGAMATGDMKINPNIITNAAVDTPLMGSLLSGATGAVPRGAVLGANVFHGGPHRWSPEPDFPHGRPRLDKIGTGEGAQAYGYGFYSAAEPNVARTYQSKVSAMQGREEPTIDGKPVNWDDPVQTAAFELARHGGNRTAAADFHASVFQGGENNRAVKLLRSDQPLPDVALPGTLYKLDIPDADVAKYLDWDKPLSEQPKSVQDALRPLLMDPSTPDFIPTPIPDNMPGYNIYKVMSETLGGDQAASEALRKAGIPGLKYFDQGSRAGGEGTRNYVTWDQDVLNRSKMLERDGVTLGANKSPTAALPGLLDDTVSRISSSFSRDQDAIGVVPNQMDDYANVTTNMTPSRYLNLAKPIDKLTESDKETIKYFEKVFREQGDKTVANPWLDITWDKSAGKWDVTGHEGRHRMIAAKNVFGPDAEIPVQLFPKQEGKGKIPIKALNDPREMSFYGLDQDTATKMKTALGQRFGMEGLPFILGANKGPTAALPELLSQQDWMNSADQVTQDTRNLLSEMLQNKARIDRERQFYESGGI